jgi:hypothetical protein
LVARTFTPSHDAPDVADRLRVALTERLSESAHVLLSFLWLFSHSAIVVRWGISVKQVNSLRRSVRTRRFNSIW